MKKGTSVLFIVIAVIAVIAILIVAGFWGSSSDQTDTTAPSLTITTPSGNTYATSTPTIILLGIASDNVEVTSVTWSNAATGSSGPCSGTTSWSKINIALNAGSNVITVTARDAAGNTGTGSITVTRTDGESPTITITSPTSSSTYSTTSSTIVLGGSASDNAGVSSVTWSNAATGGSGTCSGTTTWATSGISLSSGSNVITVTAHDASNKIGTDTITVTYTPSTSDIHLSGVGDDVTQTFVLTEGCAIFQMTHDGSTNFIIWLTTIGGEQKELLANEIGSYEGSVLVGVQSSSYIAPPPGTYYLEVTADGDWTVTIKQPRPTSAISLPQTFTGTSDNVPSAFTLTPGSIKFQMSYSGSSNFIVILYDSNGDYIELLANEIGSYSGAHSVGITSTGIYYLSVIGIGSWSITVSHL
jgi:hypothetical protein